MGKKQPSPRPTLFLDENLATTSFVDALAALGYQVERHSDKARGISGIVARGDPDTTWLPTVASRGWLILSKDKFSKAGEQEVIKRIDARVFVLRAKGANSAAIQAAFMRALQRIEGMCAKHTAPILATVGIDGKVKPVLPLTRRAAVRKK